MARWKVNAAYHVLACRLSQEPYTLLDVFKWLHQLATALDYLASRPNGDMVHGDVRPDNIVISTTGDVMLIGAKYLTKSSRTMPAYLPHDSFFAPPEARSFFAPREARREAPGLDTIGEDVASFLERVGGDRADVWSLGVVAYVLGLRVDAGRYYGPDRVQEVAKLAERADAREWLEGKLRQAWPGASYAELLVLAVVVSGCLRKLEEGRLSARQVVAIIDQGEYMACAEWR